MWIQSLCKTPPAWQQQVCTNISSRCHERKLFSPLGLYWLSQPYCFLQVLVQLNSLRNVLDAVNFILVEHGLVAYCFYKCLGN